MRSLKAKESLEQFKRFIAVGLVGTAVNYAIFYFLYALCGFSYLIASALGFLAGVGVGFPLNKKWTYGHEDGTDRHLGKKYIVVYLISLVFGLALLHFLVACLSIAPLWANVITIGFTTCTNFCGTKLWVFRK